MTEAFNADNLIYLDIEFVSLKYEEITKKAPSSQLTRTEGMKAGVNIPLFSAGVHTQETRNYHLSSLGMIREIYGSLKEYPLFNKKIHFPVVRPQIVWVQGHITISMWRDSKDKKDKYTYFQLLDETDNSDFSLITEAEYTSSGYASLFEISPAIQNSINIPISALVKILYYSEIAKTFVSAPLFMIER